MTSGRITDDLDTHACHWHKHARSRLAFIAGLFPRRNHHDTGKSTEGDRTRYPVYRRAPFRPFGEMCNSEQRRIEFRGHIDKRLQRPPCLAVLMGISRRRRNDRIDDNQACAACSDGPSRITPTARPVTFHTFSSNLFGNLPLAAPPPRRSKALFLLRAYAAT